MLRFFVFVSALWVSFASGADLPTPGGKGSYSMANQCLDTGRKLVPLVCADVTFHYELSAFMGEPLAHYGLIWRLRSFTLQDGRDFSNEESRRLFGAAADRIELMLQGTAEVRHKNGKPLAIPNTAVFDNRAGYLVVDVESGVATRAGKMSWNIAGSPDWAKFLMQPGGGECANGSGDVFIGTNVGRREFVSSAIAKEVMKAGNLELSGRQICRKGSLVEGLEDLEASISKSCQPKFVAKGGAEKPFAWCPDSLAAADVATSGPNRKLPQLPTTDESRKTDIRDDIGSKPMFAGKQSGLSAQNLERVEKQCKAELSRINACYASQGCLPKSENEIRQCEINACGSEPTQTVCSQALDCKSKEELERKMDYCESHPKDSSAGCSNGNYRYVCWSKTICNGETIPNPKYQEWKSCTQRSASCRVNDSCTTRCNPNKYSSPTDCVDKTLGRVKPLVGDAQPARPVVEVPNKPTRNERSVEDIDRWVNAAYQEKLAAQQRPLDDSWRFEQENKFNALKMEHQKRLTQWCIAETSRQSSCACASVLPPKTYSPNKGWAAGCSK